MVFQKTIWQLLLLVSLTEDGLVLGLQKNLFPGKKWNYRSINWVLAKYRHTGTTDRKKGSGRLVTVVTDENLAEVEQLCESQDDKPGTHKQPHVSLACHGDRYSEC